MVLSQIRDVFPIYGLEKETETPLIPHVLASPSNNNNHHVKTSPIKKNQYVYNIYIYIYNISTT
jgi:hypothetical protein